MKVFGQYNIFNPPAYYQQMAIDPTQVPVQLDPYGSGGGMANPYGPWPGFYFGQRPMTYEDARRLARQQATAMVRRSETSSDPKDKYITPEGRLNPKAAEALKRAQIAALQTKATQDPVASMQNRIIMTMLLGSVITALLR